MSIGANASENPTAEAAEPAPPTPRREPAGTARTAFAGADRWLPDDDDLSREGGDWNRSSHWSVPWSDLMMVMFVLFAVLVTTQMRDTAERAHGAGAPVPDERTLPRPSLEPLMRINVLERSRAAVREARIDNVEIALMQDQSVKVSVQGPMFFELGQATLRPQVTEFLSRLAGVIKQTPYAVQVIGHTDDYPVDTREYPSNWELSAARAARVARYLIRSASLDPRRFTVMGRGEFQPAVANDNDTNRSLNRRVEILITRDAVAPAENRP